MTKKATIMRGPSGAGKSTLVKREIIKDGQQAAVVSADDFFIRPVEVGLRDSPTVYDFDPAKLPEAHQWCMGQFLQAIMQGCEHVIVDNTHTRRWEYQNYELAARLAGCKVEIVEVVPKTVEEMRLCVSRNTHRVPANIIAGMVMRFEPDSRAIQMPIEGE